MKKYLLIAACLVAGYLHAQSFRYSSILNTGLTIGTEHPGITMQTIHGVRHKSWFAGIGTGYDNFGYKSIPVFADVRKTFGSSAKWKPFVYADAGLNIALNDHVYPSKLPYSDGQPLYDLYNTFLGEAGLGISTSLGGSKRLSFSAGYSYKHFSYLEHYYYFYVDPGPGYGFPPYGKHDIDYNRLAIKVQVQF